MQSELSCVKNILEKKIPRLGICLGMQVSIKASGEEVIPNNIKEIGWRDPEGEYFEINLEIWRKK
jgi:GMP synthase (glutamine-hydrolysing)